MVISFETFAAETACSSASKTYQNAGFLWPDNPSI